MKKCLLGILCIVLLGSAASAYIPEKTYSFQDGTVIRASELNQNEDDFFNAITDGRADLIIKSVSTNSIVADTLKYRSIQTIDKYVSFSEFGQVTNAASVYVPQVNLGSGKIVLISPNYIIAPVILPNGSTITAMLPSADYFVQVTLNRVAVNTSNVEKVAYTSGTTNTTTITNALVDNANYSYYLTGWSTSINKVIQYVKITYTTSVMRMD